jgi:hypothetical protein
MVKHFSEQLQKRNGSSLEKQRSEERKTDKLPFRAF